MKALAVAIASITLCAGAGAASPFKSGVLEPPRPAPDFTLRTAEGREFRLSQHRGAVVLLTFGYTACPDVCPMTLAEFAQIKARLGAPRRNVVFVFVTVDPERDTPDRIRAYTRAFDATFIGLTGSAERLAQVWRAYGVTARKRMVGGSAAAYFVDHSAFVYVIDAEGHLRLMFPFGTPVEDMTHDVALLTRS